MTFLEAMKQDKPFHHDMMIGAYKMIDGKLYHRDNISDFNCPNWIKENCASMEWIELEKLTKHYQVIEKE